MQIVIKNITALTPYEKNPRKNDKSVEYVANSISQFGFKVPVVIDKDGVIVAGHTRYKAAKKLGLKEVPCIIADDLTDEQIKAYRLADNKVGELSEWDFNLLGEELDGILDLDMSDFGFDLSDDEEQEVVEDEFDEPQEEEPRAKLGDIYQLGSHRLMCGDSTSAEDVGKLLGGARADMVLSDPPYGMHLDTDFSDCIGSIGRKNYTKGNKYAPVVGDNDDFTPKLINTFFENFGYCKEMFLFGADYFAELLPDKNDGSWLVWDKRKESQADAIGSEFELIWSRQKHKRRMLRHDWFGFLSSENAKDAQNRVHPTQKPITLIADIIKQWGEGKENIVDLFGGSGSTLIACEQLGRRCYMCEISPHYVDTIISRWEQFTGQKAVLLNGETTKGN